MDRADQPTVVRSHRALVLKLLAIIAAAFAFGFALVPLYDVLCVATGLNGKTAGAPEAPGKFGPGGLATAPPTSPARVDASRTVRVEFTATVMPGLPWDMKALTACLDLHPGELHQAVFRVHNRSDKPLVGQAIPSVTPGVAAQHFQKLDCFCFSQQTLAPGETRDMQVVFIIRPEIDRDIPTITLAYAFFQVPEKNQAPKTVALR
jgi:cytochrome c oxidase assembly protein subunit 11